MPDATALKRPVAGKTVYRRTFNKADGRTLSLYGYAPHQEAPLPEGAGDIAKGGELRWHPLRGEWNVYAAHRQHRTFKPAAAMNPLAPSKPDEPATEIPFTDFELAVFDNKFTSLHMDAPPPSAIDGLTMAPATGQCEVVVYAPAAHGSLATIGQEKRLLLTAAWIDRYEALFAKGCGYVFPFENRGDAVGVTLHHPHGQIYGFEKPPKVQQKAIDAFAAGYDLSAQVEAFAPRYAIAEAGGLTAFCPPFARFPYEVWITPRDRTPGPWAFNDEQLEGFAFLLGDVCRRYDKFFQCETPYMLGLHAAPVENVSNYHFTAQFYPLLRAPDRIKYLASVEQHTGTMTVDVMPEAAADQLRAI